MHTHIINSGWLGWGFVLHDENDGLEWSLYGFASQQLVGARDRVNGKSNCLKSELPKLLIYNVCEMSVCWTVLTQPHEHGIRVVKGLSLRPDAKPPRVTWRARHAVQRVKITRDKESRILYTTLTKLWGKTTIIFHFYGNQMLSIMLL